MNILLCSCCMAEITKPVFVNGKPYGYSCAAKFTKVGKRPTKKIVELIYGHIEPCEAADTIKTVRMVELPNGKKTRCSLYLNNLGEWTAMRMKNNFTMIGDKLYYEL